MKIGTREVVFLTLVVGLIGVSFGHFKKSREDRCKIDTETANMDRESMALQRIGPGLDELQARIFDLEKAIIFFESKLPPAKGIDSILDDFWKMAEANSLQIKTIKTLRSERLIRYGEQPIELSLRGNFYGFYSFLSQLEKLPRITRLTQMSLQKVPEHEGEMEAHLTLSIFFAPDDVSK